MSRRTCAKRTYRARPAHVPHTFRAHHASCTRAAHVSRTPIVHPAHVPLTSHARAAHVPRKSIAEPVHVLRTSLTGCTRASKSPVNVPRTTRERPAHVLGEHTSRARPVHVPYKSHTPPDKPDTYRKRLALVPRCFCSCNGKTSRRYFERTPRAYPSHVPRTPRARPVARPVPVLRMPRAFTAHAH
jgi:hypothetical protein